MSEVLPEPPRPSFPPQRRPRVRTERRDGAAVVAFSGDLDINGGPALAPLIADLANRGQQRVVLDLTGVEHVDSTGLAVLLNAKRRVTRQHGSLIIASAAPSLLRLLSLTRLSGDLDVRPTVEQAVAAASRDRRPAAPATPRR